MIAFLGVIAFVVFIVGVIMTIASSIKKKSMKRPLVLMVGGFVVVMVCMGLDESKPEANSVSASINSSESTQSISSESTSSTVESSSSAVLNSETSQEQQESSISDNILLNQQKVTLTNGWGEPINGQRAFVRIKKEELLEVTENEYIEFLEKCKEFSDCNYVSIVCDDGTGITAWPTSSLQSTYGEIDGTGSVLKTIGNIFYENGALTYEAKE